MATVNSLEHDFKETFESIKWHYILFENQTRQQILVCYKYQNRCSWKILASGTFLRFNAKIVYFGGKLGYFAREVVHCSFDPKILPVN